MWEEKRGNDRAKERKNEILKQNRKDRPRTKENDKGENKAKERR